ncbi:CLUMA_CG014030, isoform A [Clunio marinus]|uniref:CLUMA_CG014030, isoform A n=1 Tax=Clunio marinus TaxID=568069 RepID=A0A1J1IKS5_9DIPT|nr:CLUMA_CG014030, isoform A [Clunio marinus]
MTSALYLEHYLDGLESLPTELKRNFTLLRELDQRAQTLMIQIDETACDMMKNTINSKENLSEEEKKSKLKQIQELFTKAKEYGDDKVQLAIQTYELVDKHIRRLDSDLARFEGEIQEKTISVATHGKSEETAVKKGRKKTKDPKVSGKKKRSLSDEDENPDEKVVSTTTQNKSSKKQKLNVSEGGRKVQKKIVEAEEPPVEGHFTPSRDVLDMPVDPNEPTYCLCHQVSYGEMIGCDNNDCPIVVPFQLCWSIFETQRSLVLSKVSEEEIKFIVKCIEVFFKRIKGL